jgi:hypothetical protein
MYISFDPDSRACAIAAVPSSATRSGVGFAQWTLPLESLLPGAEKSLKCWTGGPVRRPWRYRRRLPPERTDRAILCALACHDTVRHRIGVLLVGVARLADATLQLHAAALLYDVCCLVRSGAQIRRRGKRDMVAGRECLRAHCARAGGSGPVGVSLDAADVMVPERSLDLVSEWETRRTASDALLGSGVNSLRRVA